MARYLRALIAALALMGLCAPIAHGDDDDDEPQVSAREATAVSDSAATLRAKIHPGDDDEGPTEYVFQYGTTTGYGATTAVASFSDDDSRTVSVQVAGLSPDTTYHFRAVAWNDEGSDYGSNRTFRTATLSTGAGISGPAPEPTMGRTVVAGTTAGEVFVRERGSSEFHPLSATDSIPVNSVLDTRDGTVALETALPKGKSQTGTFRGGMFKVRQSRKGNGMTHIALRGGNFARCKQGKSNRAQPMFRKRHKKRAIRKLWAKDKGGRFKTSGKGSVATVRGTKWFTADRCDGTLTRVTRGKVLVRERGTGQRKLLRRGQSFLARIPR